MKNLFKNLMMALIVLVAINVKATDGVDLKVGNEQSLIIEMNQIDNGSILILKDTEKEILFKDRFFKRDSFSKVIDFKSLPDGKYDLILDKEFTRSTSVITKKNDLVSIDHNAYSIISKPFFKLNENKVSIYFSNPGADYLEVEVYDKSGQSVGNIKSKDLVVKKIFDFSHVRPGEYTFKVKAKSHEFIKTFIIS